VANPKMPAQACFRKEKWGQCVLGNYHCTWIYPYYLPSTGERLWVRCHIVM